MRKSIFLLLCLTIVASTLSGQQRDPERYDRLLLPLHLTVPGVGGWWRAEWWFRNEVDAPADAFPLAVAGGLPPPVPTVFLIRYPAFRGKATLRSPAGDALPSPLIPPYVPLRSTGSFLFVEKGSSLAISGSIGWQSAFNSPTPAPLLAVHERSFKSGTQSILPVQRLRDHRYAIRIYALPETVDDPAVTVRVFDLQAWPSEPGVEVQLADLSTALGAQNPAIVNCSPPCDVPAVPLAPHIAEIFDLIPPTGSEMSNALRVEISPRSPNVRWWALVSATNNTTSVVQLYQPSLH